MPFHMISREVRKLVITLFVIRYSLFD
jgi:hypothetical protein